MIEHSELKIGMVLEAYKYPTNSTWQLARVLQIFDRKQDVGDNLSLTWVEVELLTPERPLHQVSRTLDQLRKLDVAVRYNETASKEGR